MQLKALEADEQKLRRVRKCLAFIEIYPRHPGLRSYNYSIMKTVDGRDFWESYVENKTPDAWRAFWFYGPGDSEITIVTITEHP